MQPTGRPSPTHPAAAVVLALLLAALGACSSSDSSSDTSTSAGKTTTTAPEKLVVLVTNDDGYSAPGIAAIADALAAEPDVEVHVVAPAENQSGTSDRTTDGELATAEVQTATGRDAVSVAGYPADSVNAALDQLGLEPDLVVSGINMGQNLGPLTDISGTVGAARTAARRGIPALAVSQGLGNVPDYPTAAELTVQWFEDNRADIAKGPNPTTIANLNVPTCGEGTLRGVVEVPVATDLADRNITSPDCTSTTTDPADDVDAFLVGYAALSELGLD